MTAVAHLETPEDPKGVVVKAAASVDAEEAVVVLGIHRPDTIPVPSFE